MTPKIAVQITAQDKTAAGRASAEKGFAALAKRSDALAKDSGFARVAKSLEGFRSLRSLSFVPENAGRSFSEIGRQANAASSAVADVTQKTLGFAVTSEEAMGGFAAVAATATGVIAGMATAIIGAGVAVYALGAKWAGTGAEIGRTAATIGVTTDELQGARAALERFGVSSQGADAALQGLGQSLYDARYGANNLALGALNKLGLKLKMTKDGVVDVHQMFLDLWSAIAAQKDPYARAALARAFGMSSALPAINAAKAGDISAAEADYQSSGASLTSTEVERSGALNRDAVARKQRTGVIEKSAGMLAEDAMGPMGAAYDKGLAGAVDKAKGFTQDALDAWNKTQHVINDLPKAADAVVHGAGELVEKGFRLAEQGARDLGGALESFAARIEHRESHGHQFDRHGRPLTSSAGAIGDMQLLPESARIEAHRAGIPWDEGRFYNDKSYNQQIGQAYLKRLLQKYNGDQTLAAAAYNAGEGMLDGWHDRRGNHHEGWLKTIGDPRKGQISDKQFGERIPDGWKETRDYVANTAAIPTAKAQVEIMFKDAPPGTVTRITSDPGVQVQSKTVSSLSGVP